MKAGRIAVSAILDESVDLVARRVPGPAALMALTALPLRFLEAHFLNRLAQLGGQADRYVDHLVSLSWLAALALLPALWGRAVFAHACALASAGSVPAGRVLRIPVRVLVSYFYAACVAELLFVALGWTFMALPVLALYAGLAAATSPLQERPGPLESLLVPVRPVRPLAPFLGLLGAFAIAFPIVLVNLLMLFLLGLWLASGTSGLDVSWWQVALTFDNRLFVFLLVAGAVTILEPFWIAALAAAVRRTRAQESGEDLAARFAEIRRRPLAAALLALFLLPAGVAAETISVATYQARLANIEGRLRSGDWVGAREKARQILEDRISFGDEPMETIETDRSVLAPLARARNAAEARAATPALAQLAESVPPTASEPRSATSAASSPDAKLLQAVRNREALAELPLGGHLPEVEDGGVLAALSGFLRPAVQAIRDFFRRLWDGFLDLWPEPEEGEPFLGLNLRTVTILVALMAALLAALVLRSLRNRRRGPAPAEAGPAPLSPAADEDPLSREANEWERYARELAAAGRSREAIRAWYHAVLVALYRAGALHYRKGRTNWEYVSAVPPGLPWRSRFMDLTRGFEREWYGRDSSSPEALRDSEEMALFLLGAVRERAA